MLFRKTSFIILCIGVTFFSQTSHAKLFRNSYISFELPLHWNCHLDQSEWLCRSNDDSLSKRGVIGITAKEVGPTDNFSRYEQHLNSPLSAVYPSKTSGGVSKVIYKAKNVKIQDQVWLDGLHLGSEFPGYYTRYLITIKSNLAILISYTAHRENYARFSQDFFQSVASLRIVASNDFLTKPSGVVDGSGNLFGNLSQALVEGGAVELPGQNNSGRLSKLKKSILAAAILILLASLVYFWRRSINRN